MLFHSISNVIHMNIKFEYLTHNLKTPLPTNKTASFTPDANRDPNKLMYRPYQSQEHIYSTLKCTWKKTLSAVPRNVLPISKKFQEQSVPFLPMSQKLNRDLALVEIHFSTSQAATHGHSMLCHFVEPASIISHDGEQVSHYPQQPCHQSNYDDTSMHVFCVHPQESREPIIAFITCLYICVQGNCDETSVLKTCEAKWSSTSI